jgi:hypothetical protein
LYKLIAVLLYKLGQKLIFKFPAAGKNRNNIGQVAQAWMLMMNSANLFRDYFCYFRVREHTLK